MLNDALNALKTYDWGADLALLAPIDEAVIKSHGNSTARTEIENQLAAVLSTDASRDAKDYVCRKLMMIGSAASVPALAALLPSAELSHMGRYALERIQAPEAAAALRDALSKVDAPLKIGVISSLGVRRDEASVPALVALLSDANPAVASAAAYALGDIRDPAAAQALAAAKPTEEKVKLAAIDARLACAEGYLADGKKAEALAIYKVLIGAEQPKHVRLAGTRGMLACAGKN